MSRAIKGDWIDAYLEYTADTESPRSYHVWTALSCIAGALQRKCYMQWGHEMIYPNMYVILVGSAGRTRKSMAINIGQDIFKDLDLPLASESITPQALLLKMKKAEDNFIDPQGIVHTHSSITCFSKELVTLIGHSNYEYLGYLTDWWDSHEEWVNETIGRGIDPVQGMHLNILGATAPDWIATMFPIEAIGGGFTSRCIFIVEVNKQKHVPLPRLSNAQKKLRQALAHDLRLIALLQGEFSFDATTAEEYKIWYIRESENMQKEEYAIPDPRFRSYCERRSTHLRKMCISLQASNSNSRTINIDTWNRALAILLETEKLMPDVFGGLGRSEHGQVTYDILVWIQKRRQISKEKLFKHFYKECTWRTFNDVIDGLRASKLIDMDLKTQMLFIPEDIIS